MSNIASEVMHFVRHFLVLIEHETGLSIVWLIILSIVAGLALSLLFDSSQGRGRRYRRGYRVGYTETLGKERAKMRVQMEKEGTKKPGWRERKWRR